MEELGTFQTPFKLCGTTWLTRLTETLGGTWFSLCYQDFVMSGAKNTQTQCKGHEHHFVLSGICVNRVCVKGFYCTVLIAEWYILRSFHTTLQLRCVAALHYTVLHRNCNVTVLRCCMKVKFILT